MKQSTLLKEILFILLFALIGIPCFSQSINAGTIPHLAPGVKAPIGKNNIPQPQNMTTCDETDVRVFPSPNPQSEVNLSINKQSPEVILLSSNTFPTNNSGQGAYWSTNGGLNWTGSDNLPNAAFGRGDPSTAFDAAGNGYVATLNATTLNAPEADGVLMQRTNNNGTTWFS